MDQNLLIAVGVAFMVVIAVWIWRALFAHPIEREIKQAAQRVGLRKSGGVYSGMIEGLNVHLERGRAIQASKVDEVSSVATKVGKPSILWTSIKLRVDSKGAVPRDLEVTAERPLASPDQWASSIELQEDGRLIPTLAPMKSLGVHAALMTDEVRDRVSQLLAQRRPAIERGVVSVELLAGKSPFAAGIVACITNCIELVKLLSMPTPKEEIPRRLVRMAVRDPNTTARLTAIGLLVGARSNDPTTKELVTTALTKLVADPNPVVRLVAKLHTDEPQGVQKDLAEAATFTGLLEGLRTSLLRSAFSSMPVEVSGPILDRALCDSNDAIRDCAFSLMTRINHVPSVEVLIEAIGIAGGNSANRIIGLIRDASIEDSRIEPHLVTILERACANPTLWDDQLLATVAQVLKKIGSERSSHVLRACLDHPRAQEPKAVTSLREALKQINMRSHGSAPQTAGPRA